MKIEMRRLEAPFCLEAIDEQGCSVVSDAGPAAGGQGRGMRPMHLVLTALGSCSSIDILDILRKQKLEVRDYRVTLHAEREEGAIPSLFRTIHLHYRFWGDLDPDKVQRAIDLSLNKYCSVAALLSPTARIESSFEIETTGRR
jgi:putative redox protein